MAIQKIFPGQISTQDSTNGQVLTSNGTSTYWANNVSVSGNAAQISVTNIAPVNVITGALWFDTDDGIFSVNYGNTVNTVWVAVS